MKQFRLFSFVAVLFVMSNCCVSPESKDSKVTEKGNKEALDSHNENNTDEIVIDDSEIVETVVEEVVELDPYRDLVWTTNFEEARLRSEEEGKPIFGFFTGSDWCGWCIRLQKNVFAKKDFIKWANEKVILLELDFPKRKQLPPDLKKQNYELASMFKVRGYPTVWIFNTTFNKSTNQIELRALGSTGYPSGSTPGQEEIKFIDDANKILAN